MTDQEYKDIMRRLRFQCSPGAQEIIKAQSAFYDWGGGVMVILFIGGFILCWNNEKNTGAYVLGAISIVISALLFFAIPSLAEWRRKKVSREVHRKYMCQCEWHREKFGK